MGGYDLTESLSLRGGPADGLIGMLWEVNYGEWPLPFIKTRLLSNNKSQ